MVSIPVSPTVIMKRVPRLCAWGPFSFFDSLCSCGANFRILRLPTSATYVPCSHIRDLGVMTTDTRYS